MKTREAWFEKGEAPGSVRMTRRRFLKIGGTGLAGAVLLGTAGCGVFQQGGRQGEDSGGQDAFS